MYAAPSSYAAGPAELASNSDVNPRDICLLISDEGDNQFNIL